MEAGHWATQRRKKPRCRCGSLAAPEAPLWVALLGRGAWLAGERPSQRARLASIICRANAVAVGPPSRASLHPCNSRLGSSLQFSRGRACLFPPVRPLAGTVITECQGAWPDLTAAMSRLYCEKPVAIVDSFLLRPPSHHDSLVHLCGNTTSPPSHAIGVCPNPADGTAWLGRPGRPSVYTSVAV